MIKIGLLKEIKVGEGRVALIPKDVKALVDAGHWVDVEKDAGLKAGFTDSDYAAAGASVGTVPGAVWASDIVVKVKEPQKEEFMYFRPSLKLLSYLHLAAQPDLRKALLREDVQYTPLEDVEMDGRHPALDPMSIVAGRVAVNLAFSGLFSQKGGMGKLLGGVLGTHTGVGVIIGGGVSGMAAAKEMLKHSMDVVVFDVKPEVIASINRMQTHSGTIVGKASRPGCIMKALEIADVVIGAVLIPGKKSPVVINRVMLQGMKAGSVLVDIAIDQGGCVEGIEYTDWDNPFYWEYQTKVFAIPNLPGAVPATSSIALSDVVSTVLVDLIK